MKKDRLIRLGTIFCIFVMLFSAIQSANVYAMEQEVEENSKTYYYNSTTGMLDESGQEIEHLVIHEGEILQLSLGTMTTNGSYCTNISKLYMGSEWVLGLGSYEDDMKM